MAQTKIRRTHYDEATSQRADYLGWDIARQQAIEDTHRGYDLRKPSARERFFAQRFIDEYGGGLGQFCASEDLDRDNLQLWLLGNQDLSPRNKQKFAPLLEELVAADKAQGQASVWNQLAKLGEEQ